MRYAAIAILLGATAATANAQIVGHWTFEEGTPGFPPASGASVLDQSGAGHHGTAEPGLVYHDGVDSSVGLDFRGTQARVRIPDGPDFHLRDGFTLEGYLRLERVGPGSTSKRYMVFRGDRRAGADPWWLAVNADGSLAVQVWDGSESMRLDATDPIPLRQWLHVAGTFDADSGTLSLYLDHQRIAHRDGVTPPAADLLASHAPTAVLGNSDFTSEGVEGILDDVRISGRALEPVEFLPPIEPCRADLDGDGELTIFDFFVFQGYFGLGDLRADFDGDGVLTVFDFLAFQTLFDAGCI